MAVQGMRPAAGQTVETSVHEVDMAMRKCNAQPPTFFARAIERVNSAAAGDDLSVASVTEVFEAARSAKSPTCKLPQAVVKFIEYVRRHSNPSALFSKAA